MSTLIITWRESLRGLLDMYERRRGPLVRFFPGLFLFFVLLNIGCYWWAMFTAFPEHLGGAEGLYYFKVQFPVGFLGALFDSLSFFVTVVIIRRALRTRGTTEYVTHLSLDVAIAVLATFWVLFVFSFSGWLIRWVDVQFSALDAVPKSLAARNDKYERLLVDAIRQPVDNWRNIYFGLIMGASASLPTCVHLGMFLRSGFRTLRQTGGDFR